VQHIEATQTFMHCPRCRHAIRGETTSSAPTCPRCLERSGVATRMYASPLNSAEMRHRLERVRPFHGMRDLSTRLAHRIPRARPVRPHTFAS
jgi:tRNA G26 N,N-dimethylase Trm1